MPTKQGDISLLNDPIAQELLNAPIPAHLSYVWKDGTPRVIPIGFTWTGSELVTGTPHNAPKILALKDGQQVAITIDSYTPPYHVLYIRGNVRLSRYDGIVPEWAQAGERRPSRQLADLLAKALEIPTENQPTFIQVARGERSVECLHAIIPSRASLPVGEPRSTTVNLPRSLTPFIGREPELGTLGQLLQDPQCSLITLVGPGGIGKTRLVIEAANQYKDRVPDGVWFVALAALNSPGLIVPSITDAIVVHDPFNFCRAKISSPLRSMSNANAQQNHEVSGCSSSPQVQCTIAGDKV